MTANTDTLKSIASSTTRSLKGERMLSVRETAQILGWCQDSVRRHLRAGDMPGKQVGRNWKIPESQLAAYMGLNKGETVSSAPSPSDTFMVKDLTAVERRESDEEIVSLLLRTKNARTRILELVEAALKDTGATAEVIQRALEEIAYLLKAA